MVRNATPADAALIAGLTQAAWNGKVAATSSGHRETAERVRQHLQSGGGYLLLVEDVTVGSVRRLPSENRPDIREILRMGVLPAYRGRNLLRHLLQAVFDAALKENVTERRYARANPLEPAPVMMRKMLAWQLSSIRSKTR